MCGIAGWVDYSSRTSPEAIKKMTDEIVYRGPDSTGKYTSENKNCALGIRRLSIIDLSTGDQPIKNEDGSVVVVYNGEVYNYQNLRDKLEGLGHKFSTTSDTEVLVHLYEEYKEEMPKYLDGMFAFALWDQKRQTLFIARDRVGIKPLYYLCLGNKLIFGSEIKTILAYPGIDKKINIDSVNQYLFLGYFPTEQTIYDGIRKLTPGKYLTFGKKGLVIKDYYEFERKNVEQEDLETRLRDSIHVQRHADVPVGVFLSGGIDSSLVAWFLSREKKDLKSFSISFKEKGFDESRHSRLVARRIGTEHYDETFTSADLLKIYSLVIGRLDEPFADPSFFPTFKVSQLARRHVKVVLSGDGADELFGGYPNYQGHLFARLIDYLPEVVVNTIKSCVQIAPASVIDTLPAPFKNYDKKRALLTFLAGLKNEPSQRHLFWMKNFFLGYEELGPRPDFSWLKGVYNKTTAKFDLALKMQYLDFATYLRDDLLFKVDRASMYNSLEVRVPFLANDVIDYAFSLGSPHVTMFATKRLLRGLLRDKLPEIATRSKKGFGIPLAAWMNGEIKDFIDECLDSQKLYNYVDRQKVLKLVSDHRENRSNNAGLIWALVMLSGWLESWMK